MTGLHNTPLERAVLNTLAYRSVFNSGATFYQLYTFLLADQSYEPTQVAKTLIKLLRKKKLQKKGDIYFLQTGKKINDWRVHANYARARLERSLSVLQGLQKIKWIKLLCVSGSVAALNSKEHDDVDIFIITQRNRLWLTRFFTVMYLKKLNKYPSARDHNDKVCPNIFIDEDMLTWSKEKQNVYTATEMLMMQPIFDRDNTYFRFLAANTWLKTYYPNFAITLPKGHNKGRQGSLVVDVFELLVMVAQLWYMRGKKTTEITLKNFIHFNLYDHSETVLQKYSTLSN